MTAQAARVDFDAAADAVGKNTLQLLPMWMDNWAANLQLARNGDSLDKLFQRPPAEKVLVVGRGPSIRKHGHLELLARHPFPGQVIASDGGLPLLLGHGVLPYLSMTVDGSAVIAKWFDDPTSLKLGSKIGGAILPLTAHPKTVAACRRAGIHVYWYIPELDQDPVKGATEILQLQTYSKRNPTGVSRSNGCGNCGLAAINIAMTILRAKEVVLIGMDGGYPPDTPLEECHYHEGMMRSCGYNAQQVAQLYRMYQHPLLGFTVVDPVFEVYKRTYETITRAARSAKVRVVNATEGGCLFGEGTEVMRFQDYLRR